MFQFYPNIDKRERMTVLSQSRLWYWSVLQALPGELLDKVHLRTRHSARPIGEYIFNSVQNALCYAKIKILFQGTYNNLRLAPGMLELFVRLHLFVLQQIELLTECMVDRFVFPL